MSLFDQKHLFIVRPITRYESANIDTRWDVLRIPSHRMHTRGLLFVHKCCDLSSELIVHTQPDEADS